MSDLSYELCTKWTFYGWLGTSFLAVGLFGLGLGFVASVVLGIGAVIALSHLEPSIRGPCRVCGETNTSGHGCHVEFIATAARQKRVHSRRWGTFNKTWWNGVVRDYYGDVWKCSHEHRERDTAHRCARKVMRQFQIGERSTDNIVGPRPGATTMVNRIPPSDLTAARWREICEKTGHRCHYCDEQFKFNQLEREHAVPIARGGANNSSNIVPSCGPCNREKGTMTEDEYLEFLRKTSSRTKRRKGRRESRPAYWKRGSSGLKNRSDLGRRGESRKLSDEEAIDRLPSSSGSQRKARTCPSCASPIAVTGPL